MRRFLPILLIERGASASLRPWRSSAIAPSARMSVAKASSVSVAERCDDIRTPPQNKREYRHVTLSNGLRALLIHDAEAEKAAAALEVRAGHFQDPPQMPGLAHFTEHMMFLGTAFEPEEGAFKAFLQRHGGTSNAFTGMESTGYHFSVVHDALPEALARFAAFFTCPLLRASSCAREMNAVDSEYRRNLQDDSRRLFQLVKSTASHDHPFSKFSTGCLDTLSAAQEPAEAVRAFYERHYLAGAMQLCVIGREPLDQLEALVLASLAELRVSPPAEASDSAAMRGWVEQGAAAAATGPLAAAQRGAVLRAIPVRETRLLRLMWEVGPEAEL